jgi:hypothetical protein
MATMIYEYSLFKVIFLKNICSYFLTESLCFDMKNTKVSQKFEKEQKIYKNYWKRNFRCKPKVHEMNLVWQKNRHVLFQIISTSQ